ncbi:hypothetical protein BO85DRAFT_524603 [Aspergillus piperis CBS 112811]|uniref:Uncharacterized protein n=1 Tax=Aspergillus piperis CBS 112811 TaxID=1448313 RepID=A0A8G1QVJ4_9EURO|nr:hypothetical protein BO85DRAFT_524603 [Aspergillus piperis CBS 112811]RAH52210.1 hypothetical protein BO85DRAFT_524603 [Aspergillus piperis CBS 112811]
MARQFQPYEPELHKLSSTTSDSPSSPYPRGGTPLSFKPNVNRAKTKRWVEAKKYSYDGNDWGDDEYGEYDDEDETPPVPQPPSMNQSTGDIPSMFTRDVSRPPLPSVDRSRSMDQVATLDAAGAGAHRSLSADRMAAAPNNNRTVPIVRPAEIYKRMRAESAARQQASEAGYFVDNPSGAAPPGAPVSQDTASTSHEQQGAASPGDHILHPAQDSTERPSDAGSTPHGSHSADASTNESPIIQLPDMKRLSGFNPDLSLGPHSNAQVDTGSEGPDHKLQHNPSLGFRSVVHQAFDVPETPSTTVDSIARSNSDSTSVISPIIPQHNPSETKTPTIVEEPETISTPKEEPGNMVFKPGHRRDLSLPSPNNSPSRTPVIASVEGTAPSAVGEMSSNTPDSPQNIIASPQKATMQLPQPDEGLPAPLSVGGSHPPPEPTITTGDGVPVIIPSFSTDNSPQDTESDRLRKEIIRSLSRENTPSEDPDHEEERRLDAPQQDSSHMLDEYERYWTKEALPTSREGDQPPDYDSPSAALQDTPAQPTPLIAAPTTSAPAPKPKLTRRFSWESSSSGEPAPETGVQSPPVPMPGQFPPTEDRAQLTEIAPNPEPVVEEREAKEPPSTEKPKLTIVPPVPDDRSIISDGQYLPEVYNAEVIPDSHADEGPQTGSDRRSSRVMFTTPATVEPTLLGFREILAMKTSEERVRAFNDTRAKFGTIDTGLNQWISVTVQTHPEHNDVVEKSTKLTTTGAKAPVSRGKFPKLAALGKADLSPSGSGHARRPSAPLGAMMNKQQVEQRGKELLHTAGVLGGRAGEAAKGFFARSRSKLKGGGNDKGFQSSRGYRRPVPLSELQQAADLDPAGTRPSHQRHSVHFGSLPVAGASRPAGHHRLSWGVKRKEVPGSDSNAVAIGEDRRRASIHLGAVARESFPSRKPAPASDPRKSVANDAHEQQQERLDDSGTSRIQLALNDAPLATPGQPGQAGQSVSGQLDGVSDSDQAGVGGDAALPPAAFVQPRRGSVQPSISSLGTQDAVADPPFALALNGECLARPGSESAELTAVALAAPLASSSLSLPSIVGHHPDTEMGATGNDRSLLRPLNGRHPPSGHLRVSSMSSLRPSRPSSRNATSEANSRSQDSTPHARLAALKMKYGDKIRDIRRISLGPSSPSSDQKPPLLDRLTGLFRTNLRPHRPKSRQSNQASRPETPIQRSTTASPSRPINHTSSHTRFYSLDHALPNASDSLSHLPPSLPRIPTPDSFRQAQNQAIFVPHASTPTLHNTSSISDDYLYSSKTVYEPSHTPTNGSPERGRTTSRTYVQELHLRSRSPKESAPRPEETTLPNTDATDPAIELGRFARKPRTSRVGDQELPWKLSLSGLGGDPDEHVENEVTVEERDRARREASNILESAIAATTIDQSHMRNPEPTRETSFGVSPSPLSTIPESVASPSIVSPSELPPRDNSSTTAQVSFSDAQSRVSPSPSPTPNPDTEVKTASLCREPQCINTPPTADSNPSLTTIETESGARTVSNGPTPSTQTNSNLSSHPHRPAPPRALVSTPVELPVPSADGGEDHDNASDASSEPEIVMSSTAYPGQEWRPVGYMGYESGI